MKPLKYSMAHIDDTIEKHVGYLNSNYEDT